MKMKKVSKRKMFYSLMLVVESEEEDEELCEKEIPKDQTMSLQAEII